MVDQHLGTLNTNIFGELPVDKENSLGVVASPSPDPNKAFDTAEQVFDIWGRFAKASVGKAKMQEVFTALHRKQNYTLGDFHVYLSYAVGTIDDLDRDANKSHLYKITFSFTYREN
jgi:hypothetical protein